MARTGTYEIVCTVTGRRYVGSCSASRGVEYRWKTHLRDLRAGRHHSQKLQRAWDKYGEDEFVFALIQECPPEDCRAAEQRLLDAVALDETLNCAPLATGGGTMSGRKHSPETRAKMAEAARSRAPQKHTPETKAKMSAARAGKATRPAGWSHTEEACAAIATSRRGKPCSEETRSRMSAARRARGGINGPN
jgi:group I intron endonuclease